MSHAKRRARIAVELIDEVVFSERAATAGGHHGLNYIPGASLLGAAAKAYGQFSDKYTVFHSGVVRFGNLLPTESGTPAVPMPLAWHEAKAGSAGIIDGQCVGNNIWNLQCGAIPADAQPKQLRVGYVTGARSVLVPKMRFRMKTAIDPVKRRAAESQLFGYESLAAGQHFTGEIEADALSDADWALLKKTLSGTVYLGRSRNAQYGRARLTWAEPSDPLFSCAKSEGDTLNLLALSDIALEDEWGVPVTVPTGELAGLPSAKWIAEKSFMRFRTYSNYNAHYKRYECERQVITMGSVMRFEKTGGFIAEDYENLARALGVYRQYGLGRVWVNPPFLSGKHPNFDPVSHTAKQTAVNTVAFTGNSDWVTFLQGKYAAQSGAQSAIETGRALARGSLPDIYKSARSYQGIAQHLPSGPTRSNWQRVAEAARNCGNLADLASRLFDAAGEDASRSHAICKANDEHWGLRVAAEGKSLTYAQWLKAQLEDPQHVSPCEVIASLAEAATKMIQRKELL